jgi:MYXO-CTERM domain-containing protein
MKTRAALIVAVLGTASSVFAQAQTEGSITYALSFQVYAPTGPAGTPWQTAALQSGTTVNAGQAALLRLTATMSGTPGGLDPNTLLPAGSPQHWNPALPTIPPGSTGTGGLAGFWGGDVNVVGDGGAASAQGNWSNNSSSFASAIRRTTRVWTAGAGNGFVNGDVTGTGVASSVTDIQPAQFTDDSNAMNHSNGQICWTGLWIPSSYAARTVNFAAVLGSLGFLSQIGAMDNTYDSAGYHFPLPLNVTTSFGTAVSVAVVPGPSSLALLGLGGLVAARRRR